MTCGSFREAGVTPLTRTANLTPAPDCPFLAAHGVRRSAATVPEKTVPRAAANPTLPTSSSVLPPFLLPAPSCPACVRREVRSFAALLAWPKGSSKRPKSAVFLFLLERGAPQQGDDGRGVRGRYAMGYRLKEGRYAPRSSKRSNANGHYRTTLREERERTRSLWGWGENNTANRRAGERSGAGGRPGTCQNT